MDDEQNKIDLLKIGYKRYSIEISHELDMVVHGDCYGAVNYQKSIIRIANKLERHDKNQTLIHEMIHCICSRFGLFDLTKDDATIDLLATGIYEAILDNPHIFSMTDM